MSKQRLYERARRSASHKGLKYRGTTEARQICWLAGYRAAERDLKKRELTTVTAPAVTCDHFPGQTACEWCHGTGAIDAPTSADDPSCPECDGEGHV